MLQCWQLSEAHRSVEVVTLSPSHALPLRHFGSLCLLPHFPYHSSSLAAQRCCSNSLRILCCGQQTWHICQPEIAFSLVLVLLVYAYAILMITALL